MLNPDESTKDYYPELLQLLNSDVQGSQLLSTVENLANLHGNRVYKEILMVFVGKHFGSDLATRYWQEAVEHCRQIYRPEYVDRGFLPALFDYLRNVVGELSNPRIIEADYLHNITRSSITDGLTGLYNQTYFKKILGSTIANPQRSVDQNFAVVLFDLDHFKMYNDRCGHLYGDEALRLCASLLTNALRDGDFAARYGGEEFALFLPNVDRHAAYSVAERIRGEIESFSFPKQESMDSGNLTISGGIAVFPDDGVTLEEIIKFADEELYKAKNVRNTINCLHSDRRHNKRVPLRSLVEYATCDGDTFRSAISIDVSEGGMGLGCETSLLEGMTVSVRLTRPYWPCNMNLSAKVRQVRRKNELVYVGLEFDESLKSLDDLLYQDKSTFRG